LKVGHPATGCFPVRSVRSFCFAAIFIASIVEASQREAVTVLLVEQLV
jgi:hypothetical protein